MGTGATPSSFAVVVVGDIDVLERGRVAGQTVMVASIVEIGSEVDGGGRGGGAVGVRNGTTRTRTVVRIGVEIVSG